MHFVNDGCAINDKEGENVIVKGLRTSDNCYVIEPNKQELGACLMSQKDETNIRHQRLGHINFRDLVRLSKKEIVKDLPRLRRLTTRCVNVVKWENKLKSLIRKQIKYGLLDL